LDSFPGLLNESAFSMFELIKRSAQNAVSV